MIDMSLNDVFSVSPSGPLKILAAMGEKIHPKYLKNQGYFRPFDRLRTGKGSRIPGFKDSSKNDMTTG